MAGIALTRASHLREGKAPETTLCLMVKYVSGTELTPTQALLICTRHSWPLGTCMVSASKLRHASRQHGPTHSALRCSVLLFVWTKPHADCIALLADAALAHGRLAGATACSGSLCSAGSYGNAGKRPDNLQLHAPLVRFW